MSNAFTPAQIERLKRQAKQICQTESLIHAQALDRVAKSNGHDNWSLLRKHSARLSDIYSPPPYMFTRSVDEMREVLRKVSQPSRRLRDDFARSLVPDIDANFVSAINAVDFAIDYTQRLLEIPRFKVDFATQARWEMRCWLPYCVHIGDEVGGGRILVNRRYKPVGRVNDQYAVYANFPHLHLLLNETELSAIKAPKSALGFLFNDGNAPWQSREYAQAYLERLRVLQRILKNQSQ